jgi:hypothetical protein
MRTPWATIVAAGFLAAACAERLTAPELTASDYVLVAVADSTGRFFPLPVGYLIAPSDSEMVYGGTFSLLSGQRWRYADTVSVGFAGSWGPRVAEADSGTYQYSIMRDSTGRSVSVLSFDPLNLEYEPARLIGDSVFWGREVYVRLR